MRLIEADALKKAVCCVIDNSKELVTSNVALKAVLLLIDAQPTVAAESVKHGRWIEDDVKRLLDIFPHGVIICSICGWKQDAYRTKYCCNCGARMDGEANGTV